MSGGLNGVQASHGQTTDWAGKSLEGAGWRRFLVLARGVVIWKQMYEHLAQGGQALAVGVGEGCSALHPISSTTVKQITRRFLHPSNRAPLRT
jgi:hypothetical protein